MVGCDFFVPVGYQSTDDHSGTVFSDGAFRCFSSGATFFLHPSLFLGDIHTNKRVSTIPTNFNSHTQKTWPTPSTSCQPPIFLRSVTLVLWGGYPRCHQGTTIASNASQQATWSSSSVRLSGQLIAHRCASPCNPSLLGKVFCRSINSSRWAHLSMKMGDRTSTHLLMLPGPLPLICWCPRIAAKTAAMWAQGEAWPPSGVHLVGGREGRMTMEKMILTTMYIILTESTMRIARLTVKWVGINFKSICVTTWMATEFPILTSRRLNWPFFWGMVQAWVGHFVTHLKVILSYLSTHDESWIKNRIKSTNNMTNNITMVVEPLTPPAVWIWWTHATQGVGNLEHVCSDAALEAIQ